MSRYSPLPPPDAETRNIIDKLAQFVARNGPEFESMTKEKQRDNPKFSFLYGGEFCDYYHHKVEEERSLIQKQQQQSGPGGPNYQWGGAGRMDRHYGRPPSWDERSGGGVSAPNWPRYSAPSAGGWQQPPGAWSQSAPPPTWCPPRPGAMGTPPAYPGPDGVPAAPFPPPPHIAPRAFGYPPHPGFPSMLTPADDTTSYQRPPASHTLTEADVKNSEENLKAQHGSIMEQKAEAIRRCINEAREQVIKSQCDKLNVSLPDINNVVQPLIESCTKENIAKGKNWAVDQMSKSEDLTSLMGEYLLYRVANTDATFDLRLHIVYLLNDLLHHVKRRGVTSHFQVIFPIISPFLSQNTKLDRRLSFSPHVSVASVECKRGSRKNS
ncbi:unnamed protein product [Schistocephalus solidus]|uniref:SURP motif domain-containing protein n=1 Tax=Schistocephalus solidus TaxID=70667 RepID=A0A183SH51_SCHSO|nr:unnamed protein product [Schistocephalus solidus]